MESRAGRAGPSFAEFYRRHERSILAYFVRRVSGADVAADLTSETFARALESRASFVPRDNHAAIGWLFGIARYTLTGSIRRGRVEHRARQRLRIERPVLEDERLAAINELGGHDGLLRALRDLPAEQFDAVHAYVLDEDDYPTVAARLECSQAVARKRVSRGLARLRRTTENPR